MAGRGFAWHLVVPTSPGDFTGPRVGWGSQRLGGFVGEILPMAPCPPFERPYFSEPGRGSAAAARTAPCGVRSS